MKDTMKKIIKAASVAVLAMLCILSLASCIPDHVSGQYEKETVEKGKAVLTAYLNGIPGVSDIDDFDMLNAAAVGSNFYAGSYCSDLVECSFKVGGINYKLLVDLETSELYSNYGVFDIDAALARQLKPYFEKYGFTGSYTVKAGTIVTKLVSHDIPDKYAGKTLDTYVTVTDMVPVSLPGNTDEEKADNYLKNTQLEGFTVYYDGSTYDGFIDPRAISDYLADYKNWVRADSEHYNSSSYKISGMSAEGYAEYLATGNLPASELLTGNRTGAVYVLDDEMSLSYVETMAGVYEKDGFVVRYEKYKKSGSIEDYEKDEPVIKECPVVIGDGVIEYSFSEGTSPELLLTGEPADAYIKRTAAESGEEVYLQYYKLADKLYTLYIESAGYRKVYSFDMSQTISVKPVG